MSDGFGEGLCNFSHWYQKPGTTGKRREDFEKIVEDGKPVFFVKEIFEL